MSTFAQNKRDHEDYGHDVWVNQPGLGGMISPTFRDNVCRDVGCERIEARILPAQMMELLLDNSCSNEEPDGYSSFWIELHCAQYEIIAKKVMGHWIIKSYERKD